MKHKRAIKTHINSRYYYDVIVGIHTKDDDLEDSITRDITITSDSELSVDEVIHNAADIIHDLVDKQKEYQQYDVVQVVGVTILGAYDREL